MIPQSCIFVVVCHIFGTGSSFLLGEATFKFNCKISFSCFIYLILDRGLTSSGSSFLELSIVDEQLHEYAAGQFLFKELKGIWKISSMFLLFKYKIFLNNFIHK